MASILKRRHGLDTFALSHLASSRSSELGSSASNAERASGKNALDPITLQIAEMVHDADLEDEKFDRKEAVGIDLMLKGLAEMKKSSDEILAVGISAVEGLFHALKRAIKG